MRMIFDHNALENTTEQLFPLSKNRSQRILKKLVKRHGGMFRKKPVMWRVGNVIYAHPSFKAELERLVPKA